MVNFEQSSGEGNTHEDSNGEMAPEAVEIVEELAEVEPHQEFLQASISQAKSMAEMADIEATDELVKTYCYLREMDSKEESINGITPATSSDQKLFNQTLQLLGREDDAAQFKATYN